MATILKREVDYSILNTLLAKLAIKDNGLTPEDLDLLRDLVNQGGTAEGVRDHVRRVLPQWQGRPDVLALLVDVLAAGGELE